MLTLLTFAAVFSVLVIVSLFLGPLSGPLLLLLVALAFLITYGPQLVRGIRSRRA
jgi:hypothetical protein